MTQSGSVGAAKNVVLVHGAFADDSSWSKIVPLLKAKGFRVTTAGNPLTSFADDVAATKRAIAAQDGPTFLVGHSYGGVVITEAGNDPKVVSLVYVAAFAPDAGQSIGEISQAFAKPAGADQLQPQPDGFLLLSQKGIEEDFAQDLTPAEKARLVAAQPKTSGAIFEAKPTAAAWRAKPAWYVVSSNDRMIDPEQEKEHGDTNQGQGHGTAVEPCRDVVASDRSRERHRRSGCQRTSSMTVEDVIRTSSASPSFASRLSPSFQTIPLRAPRPAPSRVGRRRAEGRACRGRDAHGRVRGLQTRWPSSPGVSAE
jgi:pimeloyl-ACP methyl ester carboxylesterase